MPPIHVWKICSSVRWGFGLLHFKTFEFFMQKTTDSLTRYIQGRILPNFFEGNCAVSSHIREILRFSRAVRIVRRPTRLDAAAVCDKEVLNTLATVVFQYIYIITPEVILNSFSKSSIISCSLSTQPFGWISRWTRLLYVNFKSEIYCFTSDGGKAIDYVRYMYLMYYYFVCGICIYI